LNKPTLYIVLLSLFVGTASVDAGSVETVSSNSNSPTKSETNEYIVELTQQSIFQKLVASKTPYSKNIVARRSAAVEKQQEAFQSDVRHQFQQSVLIKHKFKHLINANVISAKPSDIEALSDLKSVKRIYKVVQHKITSNENVTDFEVMSVDLLRASQLGGGNVNGLGVSVAIVDTGIDYNHVDLGGCFGDGCKVYAGYDFVNEDDDPFDDQSHGTHVAGIVAANGELKGIAPEAKLIAIKVCNETGYCTTTDIIQGLEYALNPDNNSATNDGADIVNMSLGSTSEDALLTNAVNNLVDMGVVVVVSAGNDGPDDDTFASASQNLIGSPADSEKAITVAASSGNSNIADFSTRGYPVSGVELLKPEVAAPGVSIKSTVPGGGYAVKSGTSMSSPMVAGVIALLKQISPDKTPAQLKSAIMTTAAPIVYDIRAEGVGLVNALAAAQLPIYYQTPVLNYGAVDFTQDFIDTSLSLTIENPGEEDLVASISFEGGSNPALDFSVTQPTVSVPAGESIQIDVRLVLNVDAVPISIESPAIGALMRVDVAGLTTRIPAIIFHRSFIDITFTDYSNNYADLNFMGQHGSTWHNIWSPISLAGQTKRIFMAPDEYDLFTTSSQKNEKNYDNSAFLFYDNLKLENSISLEVSPKHAIHNLVFDIDNPDGGKLSGDVGLIGDKDKQVRLSIYDKTTGDIVINDFLTFFYGGEKTFAFSAFPKGYIFNVFSDLQNEQHSEFIHFSHRFESPIIADIPVSINADEFQKVQFDFNTGNFLRQPVVLPFLYYRSNLYDGFGLNGSAPFWPLDEEVNSLVYYLTPIGEEFRYIYFSNRIQSEDGAEHPQFSSPYFKINQDKKLVFYNFYSNEIVKELDESESYRLSIGKLLPFWVGEVRKNEENSFVYRFTDNDGLAFYQDTDFSFWLGNVIFRTNNIESIVPNRYAKLLADGNTQDIKLPNQTGNVQTEIVFNDYVIEERSSQISTALSFDLDNAQFRPPAIKNLQITSNGLPTHQLQCGKGSVIIEFKNSDVAENLILSIKSSEVEGWQDLTVILQNGLVNADLSGLGAGFYDLRFTATNAAGNSLTYKAQPAFHVAEYEANESDDDCDGVVNDIDAFPFDPLESLDTDNDGIGNNADSDDDNDGVEDESDMFPLDSSEARDFDNDGLGDNSDQDDDNDNISDSEDAFPFDSAESIDTDNDGIGNNADSDDDNDGVEDESDLFPLDSSESGDFDNDGLGDNSDNDDDNDNILDSEDAFPFDAAESLDTDNDGIGNNADLDDDNDGVNDLQDAYPLDKLRSETPRAPESNVSGGGSLGVILILFIFRLFSYQKKYE
jgi:subtilisin family serine protease